MNKILFIFSFFLLNVALFGQDEAITVEGYAYETDNRGYLNEVYVAVMTQEDNQMIGEAITNQEGYFSIAVQPSKKYILVAKKDLFFEKTQEVDVSDKSAGEKIFIKLELTREPGYLFDITIAPERSSEDEEVDGILGATIEIYNNTKEEVALEIEKHPSMNFTYTFKKGNYYTMLIRKEGFFTKRLEAHVNIDGCILCFEGVGGIRPAITDNLTAGHEMGTLLANIELKRIVIDEPIPLDNIYYDYRSSEVRADAINEVEKLIDILRDNPHLIVELSSHTDSRGDAPYNLNLSQQRAESVVDYLVVNGDIDPFRIRPKGYGETKLVNKFTSGVECTEEQHQKNRRTELKVVGFLGVDPLKDKSLADIKDEERIQKLLMDIQQGEQIQIPADGPLPDEIQKDLDKEKGEEVIEGIEKKVMEKKVIEEKVIEEKTIEGKDSIEVIQEKAVDDVEEPSNITAKRKMQPIDGEITGFFVQVMHSSNKLGKNHPAWAAYQNVYIEERENGGYSYLMGIYPDRETAEESLKNVLSEKFSGAFIVEINNGKRIK